MLLTQFPDIGMVRRLRNEATQPADKWMNVALNVKCKEVDRAGVESPYSLFMNKHGHSYCNVNRKSYRIETDTYLLTRPGEQYDLVVDNLQQTEVFNIHINKQFFDNLAYTLTATDSVLLNNPDGSQQAPYLFTQLYPKDTQINALIGQIATAGNDNDAFERALADLLVHMLITDKEIGRKIAALPLASLSVKTEIYQRLALARDLMHSNYSTVVDLDELCKETAMSKFHFLRMFKLLYGITPHQYLTKIRMDKAVDLLKHTQQSVNAISDTLGFEYPNSFIKAFQKNRGIAPLQFRKVGLL